MERERLRQELKEECPVFPRQPELVIQFIALVSRREHNDPLIDKWVREWRKGNCRRECQNGFYCHGCDEDRPEVVRDIQRNAEKVIQKR